MTSNAAELLTIKQVSEMLQVHPNTLRQWEKKGILSPVRISARIVRYRREDIDRITKKED